MTPRAVIFDMDGVLIDSEPLWHLAEIEVLGGLGVPLTPADCALTTGLRIDEVVGFWRARHPWSGPDSHRVARGIVARMCGLVAERGEAKAGAVQAVRFVAETGARLALASSSDRVLIDAVLNRLMLNDLFEVTCSAEDEPFGKPHPGVYLSTLARLGLAAGDAIAIEDSGNGVRSAVGAGLRTLLVPDQAVEAGIVGMSMGVLGSLDELPGWWSRRFG